eukprot:349025-Alexandrium_andersonii.AAC.1
MPLVWRQLGRSSRPSSAPLSSLVSGCEGRSPQLWTAWPGPNGSLCDLGCGGTAAGRSLT